MKLTGFLVLIVGVILTVVTTFKFFTTEKVIEVGTIEISREKPNKVSWSPILGLAVMCVGGVIIWQSNKKK